MLKKRNFYWINVAKLVRSLKKAITQPPILASLDFSLPFTIECNAFDVAVGAILM